MQPNPLGPNSTTGFTVAIEIDHRLSALSSDRRAALVDVIKPHLAHLDRSPLGNARIVFDAMHTDWWESGRTAMETVRTMKGTWSIVGIEICRSDLWLAETFLDHDADEPIELPEWCHRVDAGRQSTVVVEVEPARTPSGKRRSPRSLLKCFHREQDARLSRSGSGRPQLIIESPGRAESGAQSIIKAAHVASTTWSITRIRSVRADIYRAETSDVATYSGVTDGPEIPDWQLVSNGVMDRFVVVTDTGADMNGWSADIRTLDGNTLTRPFTLDTVWIDDCGTANIDEDGTEVTAWTARMEYRTHLVALHNADRWLDIDPWDSMAAWLVESMHGQPIGLVVELGPNDYGPDEEEDGVPVVCAQIQVLDDGVYMVRRSRAVLEHLMLADYSAAGLQLDTWHHDDHFDDCTDGYLFSRDARLIANTCIAWFRDNTGMTTPDELGCDYRFADVLPRSL